MGLPVVSYRYSLTSLRNAPYKNAETPLVEPGDPACMPEVQTMEPKEDHCSCPCGWAGHAGELRHVRFDEVRPGEVMPLGMCPQCRDKVMPIRGAASSAPRVTITIEGDVIQAIESDGPVDVLTIRYMDKSDDPDDIDPELIRTIGNGEAVCHHYELRQHSGISLDNTARIFREYEIGGTRHGA